jgi:FAD-dependent urate hydroxylase
VLTSEALIIGAGPFGVSISVHLRELGVDHLIVGRPMDTWRAHMPVGMYLKSEPYSSEISAPQAGYDLPSYCRSQGIEGVERGVPLSLEKFLGYADWYTGQLVPNVGDVTVSDINAVDGGFEVGFADADPVAVRQVVIATGVLPHFHVPAELSGLPADLVSHTADHHQLDRFRGHRVAVVGAGQSALETAALLHEAGGEVYLVVRCPTAPVWHPKPLPLTRLGQVRLPVTRLGEGWRIAFWNSPDAFRRLPQGVRATKARTVLGPRGAWWLRDRIEGLIDVLHRYEVRGAEPRGSGVRLLLDGPTQSSIDVDHVIAGTGYRMDIARLAFLPEGLRARIATLDGYPVLTRAGESTVPGLYFTGAIAAYGLGPSMRFIAGTHHATPQLARSVARRFKVNGRGRPVSGANDQMLQPNKDAAFKETV